MNQVEYRLSMPEPHSHLFQVEVRIPGARGATELVMPSWTPGSYLLREFARHVQQFEALAPDGTPLRWTKTDKNSWRVEGADGDLLVRYRVYANELSVRTSHLDASHAFVNGASTLMFVRGREGEPHALDIEAPAGWQAATSLPRTASWGFRARDYDHLVDSPLEIGMHQLLEWEQSGIPHRYAIWGRGNLDAERLLADTRKIVAAAERMFGGLPYPEYTIILHLVPDARGGLEHADSTALQADRWAFQGEEYESFLALVAHEHFHVWNAKRIRPAPLGPFDYTAENYTRSLWVVEGLTTYYTDLILLRAGIITAERYLVRLAEAIARFQALPGRRYQTLDESSFDTWIRFYRPDEHSPNAQISYYQKGALVGLLLDLEIRRLTAGERSLDDVMLLLWERYGARDVGFPESGEGAVEALAEEVAGADLSDFFDRYIRGTEELDFDRALAAAGLQLSTASTASGKPASASDRPSDAAVLEARLGIRVRDRGGRLQIANVLSEGAGYRAGLNAADEVVALDGLRVTTAAQLASRVRGAEEGAEVEITAFRRDELMRFAVALGGPALPKLRIVRMAEAGEAEAAVRGGWLGESAT